MANKYYRKQNINGKQILTEDKLKSKKETNGPGKLKQRSYKKGGKDAEVIPELKALAEGVKEGRQWKKKKISKHPMAKK